ncbi:MAG: prolyl oligopeptidase family serine peptidase, partial [Anaerolineae bacterium]|nr:prolyl oligopeptidase family serine peptidase [Anaerolineae bacterium]
MRNRLCLFSCAVLLIALLAAAVVPAAGEGAADGLPLAGRGSYEVGVQTLYFTDARRDDRSLGVELWYPAELAAGASAWLPVRDAPPQTGDAPYPLLLFSHGGWGGRQQAAFMAVNLASHGFVAVGIDHPAGRFDLIDRPLDMLFVLDQLAALDEGDLVGVFDADNVGVWGISYGGYVAVAMTGARLDPAFYQGTCSSFARPLSDWESHTCEEAREWRAVLDYAAQFIDLPESGLWPAFSDPRIQAVMPLTPVGGWYFGPDGLGAATLPTLLVAGTADTNADYTLEAAYLYDYLGPDDLALLSFIDR